MPPPTWPNLPCVGALFILAAALYGLFQLYLGLGALMQAPKDKCVPYTIVVIVCGLVLGFILGMVVFVTGLSRVFMPSGNRLAMTRAGLLDGTKPLGGAREENPAAAMGALFGGAGMAKDTVDADTLKALLPDAVGAPTDRTASQKVCVDVGWATGCR